MTEEELRKLSNEGYTDGEIAQMYGVSADSIRKKRSRWGIPRYNRAAHLERQWPEVRELHAQGLNDREISEILGCITQDGIRRIRSVLGLPSNYRNKIITNDTEE